jgi:small GTP-binding protein domain
MKKLVIGVLAHVDAGKTTLAESMLYLTGSIRTLGRVDHKDAFLDTYHLERTRGITIFSKQAEMVHKDMAITLLDTPGHVDFSTEMERTLQVLDYAILVISGIDGVQGHTETLWRLLARYKIPTFLFINKMDLDRTDRKTLMEELKRSLSEGIVDFNEDHNSKSFLENIAMCDEPLLEQYLEEGMLDPTWIPPLIAARKIFPCFFGSALKTEGVETFLDGLNQYTQQKSYNTEFGARIYKISRDDQGNRLTYMKITGGRLKVKTQLTNHLNTVLKGEASDQWEEKVDQIRIYSGSKYETIEVAEAGSVCAVTGLSRTYPGEGLGTESLSEQPILEPVLSYQIVLPQDTDAFSLLSKLKQLEEEDPQMQIIWSEQLKEIHVKLMGEVQIEILKSIILERFGVNVDFTQGNIVYKETISEPVVGLGHFEPLRHYAEVHLLLEPNEPGGGLAFATNCSEDSLDRNWQRLIITHLEEKEHVGVLTGSAIADMKITLIVGRAHQKHTEGGDFRQATYRALRQGLKSGNSILLEPFYNFKLEIPSDTIGRAISDIQRLSGSFNAPSIEGEMAVITGAAPVATMQGYQTEVTSYTKGRGKIFFSLNGYFPCHNAQQVIESIGYDSEKDTANPTGSVFCSQGAGFVVDWDKVEDYIHVENELLKVKSNITNTKSVIRNSKMPANDTWQEDKELEEIFVRTFGQSKQRLNHTQNGFGYENKTTSNPVVSKYPLNKVLSEPVKEYLLVDGYNIIFSWSDLNELAKENMDSARSKLMDILCNYQGFKNCNLIIVFDAYKVKGGVGEIKEYHNIHVVYTKEAETADQYIEKVTHDIGSKHRVIVATSDALEQLIIMGQGATRLSASDLKEEIDRTSKQIHNDYLNKPPTGKVYLSEQMHGKINHISESDI